MEDIYNDNTYLQNNPDWHSADAPFKSGEIVRLLKLHPADFKSVCDVGCGTGEVLVQLAKSFSPDILMRGIDISEQAIQIAKTKETSRLQFECKGTSQVNEKFDLLLVLDVLEHLPNYFQFLDELKYKAKHTIFHIPLDMSVWALFREQMLIESKQRVGHIHNFTEDFIKSILSDFGFKIKAQLYTPPGFDVVNTKHKITNGLRKFLFAINKKLASKIMGGYSILILAENPGD